MKSGLLLALSLSAAVPVPAQAAPSLQAQVEAALAAAPAGTRFGLLVLDDQGREVLAINPDQRFIPASNTKLFTTAAALEVSGRDANAAQARGTTTLALVPVGRRPPDVVLTGGGAALSSAPDCIARCLNSLIAGIAAKARKVGNIIADDTAFTDQRWSPGMSWNNIPTDSGTATSALVIDDNELPLVVSPGSPGNLAVVTVSPYFTVRNEAVTVAEGATRLAFDRAVNGRELRVYGTIAAAAPPWRDLLGIDDPADFAAWMVRDGLRARGVKVTGTILLRHRPSPHPPPSGTMPVKAAAFAMAVDSAPLDEEVAVINKRSQNLHAEVLLRQLGRIAARQDLFTAPAAPDGSLEAGLLALRAVLAGAGLPRAGYDFSDGSGMSTYNRVSPRAAAGLLRWAKGRPWGAVWRASLPVAGVDGTLRRRFGTAPLLGKLWAKTGTLNATNALSGYMTAASGRELTFAIFANDVPDGANAVPAMDAALALIATGN
jgi:D-alanyl-D-alanine carboxypeptidase/D-alanyl-D-alanine-endopeptidase (penicillin-binding protein 4)